MMTHDGRSKDRRRSALLTLALAAGMALTPAAAGAAPPPGGGGGPTGTVYYRFAGAIHQMNPDGSGKTALPLDDLPHSRPSRVLHGDKRWFLKHSPLRMLAVRDDGAMIVALTDDPPSPDWTWDIRTAAQWAPDEGADGATISFTARRRSTTDGTSVPGSAGLYTARILFDGDGNVIGLQAQPEFLVSVGVVYAQSGEVPDTHSPPSWSPDMTRVVVDRNRPSGTEPSDLRIIDVATGAPTVLLHDPPYALNYPTWSLSGSTIAFRHYRHLQAIAPDGTNRRTLVNEPSSAYVAESEWFHDSSYLVYNRSERGRNGTTIDDIYRITSAGSGKTNLTRDIGGTPSTIGWR